jgi:hypothetical protein
MKDAIACAEYLWRQIPRPDLYCIAHANRRIRRLCLGKQFHDRPDLQLEFTTRNIACWWGSVGGRIVADDAAGIGAHSLPPIDSSIAVARKRSAALGACCLEEA